MANIFLITAPSGAGKTSIAERLKGIWGECISTTTRPMRDGEVEGETYYYVSPLKFNEMSENGKFAERVMYDGNSYGITHEEIERVGKLHKNIYIIVEFNGYKQVKALYPNAVGIFLHMSKEDCMANMLLRGDSMEKALNRIELYENEMANKVHYDYVIKNVRNKMMNTVEIIKNIIGQHTEYVDGGIITSGTISGVVARNYTL